MSLFEQLTITGPATVNPVDLSNDVFTLDAGAGNIALTLPTAGDYRNQTFSFMRSDTSVLNTATIAGFGGQTVGGQNPYSLQPGETVRIVATSVPNWASVTNNKTAQAQVFFQWNASTTTTSNFTSGIFVGGNFQASSGNENFTYIPVHKAGILSNFRVAINPAITVGTSGYTFTLFKNSSPTGSSSATALTVTLTDTSSPATRAQDTTHAVAVAVDEYITLNMKRINGTAPTAVNVFATCDITFTS